MVPYKRIYFYLFNRITDALRALEQGDAEKARAVLVLAQQDMEGRYIAAGGKIEEQMSAWADSLARRQRERKRKAAVKKAHNRM